MTWEDYKKEVKSIDPVAKDILEESEMKDSVIAAMIKRRNELGLSQRELAEKCGIPQSSVARIELGQTAPKLDNLIKIFLQLGLSFNIGPAA